MNSNRAYFPLDKIKPVVPVSPDEFARVRNELFGVDRLIFDCQYLAGLRPGELLGQRASLGLRYCDIVDRGDGSPYLSVYWGKTKRFRRAYMFKPLLSRLAAYRTLSGACDTDFVFPAKDGGPWTDSAYGNWLNRTFNPAVKAAGTRSFRAFDLRHGHAELVYRSGSGLLGLAEAMDITVDQARVMYSKVINRPLTDVVINPNEEIRKAIDAATKEGRAR